MFYILWAHDISTPLSSPERSPGESSFSSFSISPQKELDLNAMVSLVNAELKADVEAERYRLYLKAHANDIERLAPSILFKRLWQPICLIILAIYATIS